MVDRSIRARNTTPRTIPKMMRRKPENNPTRMLKKNKKYDIIENKRLQYKLINQSINQSVNQSINQSNKHINNYSNK